MKIKPPSTLRVVITAVSSFLLLCLGTGGYEIWTLTNSRDNDTISHIVAALTVQYPWLPTAFILFGGAFVAFWLTCAFHWWGKGFWWKPAVWVKKDDNEKEVN